MIGIEGSDISEREAKYFGLPRGILVSGIDEDCSAYKNGLKEGDIITHFNDKEVKNKNELNSAKALLRPGTEVTVTVYRVDDKKNYTIKFKLEAAE
jgi:S1-C subfamily serine protease